jgi:hypothetical protein
MMFYKEYVRVKSSYKKYPNTSLEGMRKTIKRNPRSAKPAPGQDSHWVLPK